MVSIPERLKQLRKEKKLTQADLAKVLDISESAYGYYEQGRNEISITNLKKLAEKYEVSIAYLLCETDIREPVVEKDDEAAFQAFANNPSLQKWYKELPKSREEDLERLRMMWEIMNEKK